MFLSLSERVVSALPITAKSKPVTSNHHRRAPQGPRVAAALARSKGHEQRAHGPRQACLGSATPSSTSAQATPLSSCQGCCPSVLTNFRWASGSHSFPKALGSSYQRAPTPSSLARRHRRGHDSTELSRLGHNRCPGPTWSPSSCSLLWPELRPPQVHLLKLPL